MLKKLLYPVLFIFLIPCRLLAWGHAGHAMVAELAMSMLSDATRMKGERVLNGLPGFPKKSMRVSYLIIALAYFYKPFKEI